MADATNELDSLADLERRSFQTYLARVAAYRRLTARLHAWNTLLVSVALSSAVASVALLVDGSLYGPRGDVLLVSVSIAALVASTLVPSLNYAGRARDMFSSYRRAQHISAGAERLRKLEKSPDGSDAHELYDAYETLLDESENHTTVDYARSIRRQWSTDVGHRLARFIDHSVTVAPYVALGIPVLVVARLAIWLTGG